MRTPFTGAGTALVTPFTRSGDLDEAAVRRLGRRQIDAGIHFLAPCGTTGENPTLTAAERLRIVEILVDEAGGKVPVLAGAGGYNTREVIELARELAEGRRQRLPLGHAVLQQADAGRALPALPRHRRQHVAADRRLQRAGPHRRERRGRDARAPGGDSEHRRRQGSVRQHAADVRDLPRRAAGLHRAVGRRCDGAAADGGRRTRRHFGGVERDARPRWRRWSKRPSATTSPRRARFTTASCR